MGLAKVDFKDDGPVLMLNLLQAGYWFDEALRRSRKARGLPAPPRTQAFLIINVVLGQTKPSQLAEALGVSRQAVSRMIADLVEDGTLQSAPDPEDGRGIKLSLNPDRASELSDTLATLRKLEAQVAEVIGADRMEVMRAALSMDWGRAELKA